MIFIMGGKWQKVNAAAGEQTEAVVIARLFSFRFYFAI